VFNVLQIGFWFAFFFRCLAQVIGVTLFDSLSCCKKVTPAPAQGLFENLDSDTCSHSENLKLTNGIMICSHRNQVSFNSGSTHLNQVWLSFSFNSLCFRHNHNETTTAIFSLRQCLFFLMTQKHFWSYLAILPLASTIGWSGHMQGRI